MIMRSISDVPSKIVQVLDVHAVSQVDSLLTGRLPVPTRHAVVAINSSAADARSADQLEVDVEGAIRLGCPAIAGSKRDGMLGCRSSNKGVVDSAAGDTQGGQPRVELSGSLDAEKPRGREVVRQQPRNGARRTAGRWRQPSQYGESLECRMAAEAAATVSNGFLCRPMVFVPGGRQRDRDTRVDQELRLIIAGRHFAAS